MRRRLAITIPVVTILVLGLSVAWWVTSNRQAHRAWAEAEKSLAAEQWEQARALFALGNHNAPVGVSKLNGSERVRSAREAAAYLRLEQARQAFQTGDLTGVRRLLAQVPSDVPARSEADRLEVATKNADPATADIHDQVPGREVNRQTLPLKDGAWPYLAVTWVMEEAHTLSVSLLTFDPVRLGWSTARVFPFESGCGLGPMVADLIPGDRQLVMTKRCGSGGYLSGEVYRLDAAGRIQQIAVFGGGFQGNIHVEDHSLVIMSGTEMEVLTWDGRQLASKTMAAQPKFPPGTYLIGYYLGPDGKVHFQPADVTLRVGDTFAFHNIGQPFQDRMLFGCDCKLNEDRSFTPLKPGTATFTLEVAYRTETEGQITIQIKPST